MHDVLELFGTGDWDDETHQRRETHVRGGKRGNGGRTSVILVAFVLCVDDGFVFHCVGALTHDMEGKKNPKDVRVSEYILRYQFSLHTTSSSEPSSERVWCVC